MSKLIVFDVDGTILDSLGHFEKVVEKYSVGLGLPVPCFKTIRTGYGDPHNHDFKWGVGREEQVQHLFATYRLADEAARHTPPLFYDGAHDALVHLKDLGHTLAIVTSKPEAPLLHVLEEHKVTHLFSGIRHGNDEDRRGEREKPFPDQLQSLIRELKFGPDETVMVGDTTMDIRMGRGAGTHTLGVLWGAHGPDDLKNAGAHHIVDERFDEVVVTVKKIFGA
jgi:phosphoglycolate phosphatase